MKHLAYTRNKSKKTNHPKIKTSKQTNRQKQPPNKQMLIYFLCLDLIYLKPKVFRIKLLLGVSLRIVADFYEIVFLSSLFLLSTRSISF